MQRNVIKTKSKLDLDRVCLVYYVCIFMNLSNMIHIDIYILLYLYL